MNSKILNEIKEKEREIERILLTRVILLSLIWICIIAMEIFYLFYCGFSGLGGFLAIVGLIVSTIFLGIEIYEWKMLQWERSI